MSASPRIILALVGKSGSGKTALGRYLASRHHFYHFEGSDGVREYAQKEHALLFSRTEYGGFHRKLQEKYGKDILARILLERPEDRLVFVSIRNVSNARTLQAAGGLVIALDCPIEQRFARVDHSGLKYQKTLDDFRKAEERESYSPDGYGADIMRVMEIADRRLDTSQPLAVTLHELDKLVAELSDQQQAEH